jgi:PTH1 family peptidyl-tRNA hydrolase
VEIPIQLIVGLGNPGAKYLLTRHNAGFWFVDALARRSGAAFSHARKFHGETCRMTVAGCDLRVLKPATFMNRSGQAVQALSGYLKLPPEAVLVVHDDLDLPVGSVRLKWSGGHGGHNGLRDIISHLGRNFRRLRLGIGHPGPGRDVLNYVLGRAGPEDQEKIIAAIGEGIEIIPHILESGFESAMHALHTV